ncbi:MAG: UDP-3-O-(3-hydroxymyristoyl)glucosamine N-acyltransferase [Bacteroidales bacterium]
MEVSAERIAQHFNGEIVGNPNVKVSSVAKIESGKPGNICFLANPKYEHNLYTCKASIIIINKEFLPKEPIEPTLIVVDNAYEAVASLLDLLNSLKRTNRSGRAFSSKCAWSSKIGKGAYIGDFSYVGRKSIVGKGTQIYAQVYIGNDVSVGDDCIFYPGVKIYDGCKIGNNCILHSNVVIGSDGFGFAPTQKGSYKKIPQTGIVTIEDDVEIGSNSVVDRATMGTTIIRRGTKLDNLIQVAHNVEIGSDTVIAAQTGISGSSKVGNNCQIGGQVGIAGHITIANKTSIGAQAGVLGNVRKEGEILLGSPAFDYKQYLKAYALFRKLPK